MTIIILSSIHYHICQLQSFIVSHQNYAMAGTYNAEYGNLDLVDLAEKISMDFNESIIALCHSLENYTGKLNFDNRYNEYIVLCEALIIKVKEYIDIQENRLSEYVQELSEKNNTGHNCLHCSGKCHVQHKMQLANATYLSREIKRLLADGFEIFPIPDNIQDENFKQQRLSFMLLDKTITELFYVHESYLMPAILEAQININALS